MARKLTGIIATVLLPIAAATAQDLPLHYPETARSEVVEEIFGKPVADPYRWLEGDISTDADVSAWAQAQTALTEDYLSALPARAVFQRTLAELYDFDQVTAPKVAGESYFYTLREGAQNYPSLRMREGADAEERVLLDPNAWDPSLGLAEWAPSPDGAYLAYALQQGGTDPRTIKVMDVATGETLPDAVPAHFTQMAWSADGSGFFYSRMAEKGEGASAQSSLSGHAIYYHALGTEAAADRLVFETPDQPNQFNVATNSADGRLLIIYSSPDLSRADVLVIDLEDPDWNIRQVAESGEDLWSIVASQGTQLFLFTDQDAPLGRLMTMDLSDPAATVRELIPEQDAVLNDGYLAGDRLLLSYLDDAKAQLRRFELDGTADGTVALPGMGSIMKFEGDPAGGEVLLEWESFNTPSTILRYDVANNRTTTWYEPRLAAGHGDRVVEQHFFASEDGTRVPVFTIRRKDVTGPAPTLLLGYGGYGISMVPDYSAALMAWVDQGGVAAVANIRGGAEYGPEWHQAARGLNRQNAFDDFIAAGEFLKAQGITTADGLAIYGDSNGGLLVGAVTNQRPDLIDVALPGVGVMDMIRYPLFTGGNFWIGEFGNPAEEEHFNNLLSYSPYHNIAGGRDYPPILAATSDSDTRVVPGHTFKYVAALQAADIGDMPHLVRISSKSGHGDNLSRDIVVAQLADMWAFAAYWTGLEVGP